jgi:hypothetical protein
MHHSGSCFAGGTLRARVQQGNLAQAHSNRSEGAGLDEMDAGTGNVREVMRGA